MIQVTSTVPCETVVNGDDEEKISMTIWSHPDSREYLRITVEGRTYTVNIKDLQDACQNVSNGGARL